MKANSQFISGIVLCMGLIISAACNADNLVWSELSAEQRSMLADHQGEWGGYSVKRQQRLASGADRWLTMTDAQRSQVLKSFERWGGLSQEQQSRVQKNFKKFQTFSKAEKANLKQLRERFRGHARSATLCGEKAVETNGACGQAASEGLYACNDRQ